MTIKNTKTKLAQHARQLARLLRKAAESDSHHQQVMSEVTSALAASSRSIAEIIKSIDDITSRTNKPAVNAASKTAPAGDAATDFAEAANEFRNLARRTAQSARQTMVSYEDWLANSQDGMRLTAKPAANPSGLSKNLDWWVRWWLQLRRQSGHNTRPSCRSTTSWFIDRF